MTASLLTRDALAQQFERKLQEQIAALPHFLDEAVLRGAAVGYGPWKTRTLRDARTVLQSNAAVIARREAEILFAVVVALGLHPLQGANDEDAQLCAIQESQVPVIVAGWPWTVGGEERPEHLGLPCLLADVLTVGGSASRDAAEDVEPDELAGWLRARCPAGVVNYSTPTKNGATFGELVADCHRLSTSLMLPDGSVSTQQLTWLYLNAEPADARAGLQPVRQATQILTVLASVAKGNAQRRLLDVIVPAALANERAAEREKDERVRDDLASAVRRHIARFMEHLKEYELPEADYCEASRRAIDGDISDVAAWEANVIASLWVDTRAAASRVAASHDEAFSSYVEQLGRTGKKLAQVLRAKASERGSNNVWKLWLYRPEGELYLVFLAQVLWREEVQPDTLHRESNRGAAIVRAGVADRLLIPMTQRLFFPESEHDLELGGGAVRDERRRVVATVSLTTDATLAAVQRGYKALGSVSGHLLIRALIHGAADAWNRGASDARRVAFPGGWNGLLDSIGVTRKAQQQIKDIAQAGQCIVWSSPHITAGGLWTWSERRGTRAGTGEVAFVLADALTPGYAEELSRTGGKSLPARIARRLVPELRYAPPMGGARANDRGPIWTLHRLLVIELVDHAEALHVHGAVGITQERWAELADLARVTRKILSRTLDAWVEGDSDTAPALLERHGRDRWTLASPHKLERDFIAEGGAKRVRGRRRASGT